MKTAANNTRDKRAEKKAVNIKWNSRLFFQLGVITSLLMVFFVMQTEFKATIADNKPNTIDGLKEPAMIDYVIEFDIPKPVAPVEKIIKKENPVQKKVTSNIIEVKPNTAPDVETPIEPTDLPVVDLPTAPVTVPSDPEPVLPRNMINVEFVPVFPGCETLRTNGEKVECMSSKINEFINKYFRKELLEDLRKNETHRIYVNFKIDSNGFIKDVVANSHNAVLKREAQRVITNLPTMKPGKQGEKNVDVLYTIPIVFKIQ